MKKTYIARCIPAVTVGMFCLTLGLMNASATLLLDDTFADGSRGETALPNESAVWVGHPDDVTMGVGSLAYAQSTSSHKLWTYFTADGAPATVGVGQQLVATINFIPTGLYTNTSENFRFGLFHDPTDPQVHSDTNDDGGGTGDPWTDSTGYGVRHVLSAAGGDNPQVGKRIDLANTSLLGSSGAYDWSSGGTDVENMVNGALYTAQLELDRVGADQMEVTYTFSDAGGIISQWGYSDTNSVYTDFDHLFFRMSSAAGTADVIDFKQIRVEVIPEPATIGLVGIFGAGLLFFRRMKI